ncbi:MAG: ribbon-helix-helix protein, CopG family [Bacteroidales bacterium]|nr:ribbon-helix-helix protein, CopG family [Bacteroidales bacterium]
MARRKKILSGVDPAYMEKQRQMLLRRHRNVIYLNDSEAAAITEYCQRFGVHSRSALMREAIMHKVLTELGTNPPTLF